MKTLGANLQIFRSELLLSAVCALTIGGAYGQQLTMELDPTV
jgi:hypothetical protein